MGWWAGGGLKVIEINQRCKVREVKTSDAGGEGEVKGGGCCSE